MVAVTAPVVRNQLRTREAVRNRLTCMVTAVTAVTLLGRRGRVAVLPQGIGPPSGYSLPLSARGRARLARYDDSGGA